MPEDQDAAAAVRSCLLCRIDAHLCAIPIEHVVETMRVLPIDAVPGAPRFVRGLSIIRGIAVPVIDGGLLLGEHESPPGRLVTLDVHGRTIALLVASVAGVHSVRAPLLAELPLLLQHAAGDAVSAIGALDAELLFVLNAARLVPEQVLFELLPGEGAA